MFHFGLNVTYQSYAPFRTTPFLFLVLAPFQSWSRNHPDIIHEVSTRVVTEYEKWKH